MVQNHKVHLACQPFVIIVIARGTSRNTAIGMDEEMWSEKSKSLHVSSDTSLSDWSDNHDEKQLLFTLFTDFLSVACSRFLAPKFNFLNDRAWCPSGVSRFPYLVVPQN
jgi:hypothetical protein